MNIVVIGAQWGDEGKGKIVDFLAVDAEHIVRFSGGANAGHTIVTGGVTYKLHLVPSGIIYPGKTVLLGSGMVIDPESLFEELATVKAQGVDWEGRVFVSDRAHLVFPRYKHMDIEMEKSRQKPLGTTGRGIGIAYSQKALREGFRVADLLDEKTFAALDEGDRSFLEPFRDRLRAMTIDLSSFMAESSPGTKRLFEGGQGVLLDLDIGTYPYVSSGCSAAAGASLGGGIGPRNIDKVLGVFKAYTTRVGNGPFPSEFGEEQGKLEDHVRETGREYGVTTGRARRCGYLDLVALKYACRLNGVDRLVLTHLDVYDGIDEVKACVAYDVGGERVEGFPAAMGALEAAKPITVSFPGWGKSAASARDYDDLPEEAKRYVEFIEAYTETPVGIISVGYKREHTLVREPVWKKY